MSWIRSSRICKKNIWTRWKNCIKKRITQGEHQRVQQMVQDRMRVVKKTRVKKTMITKLLILWSRCRIQKKKRKGRIVPDHRVHHLVRIRIAQAVRHQRWIERRNQRIDVREARDEIRKEARQRQRGRKYQNRIGSSETRRASRRAANQRRRAVLWIVEKVRSRRRDEIDYDLWLNKQL